MLVLCTLSGCLWQSSSENKMSCPLRRHTKTSIAWWPTSRTASSTKVRASSTVLSFGGSGEGGVRGGGFRGPRAQGRKRQAVFCCLPAGGSEDLWPLQSPVPCARAFPLARPQTARPSTPPSRARAPARPSSRPSSKRTATSPPSESTPGPAPLLECRGAFRMDLSV